jgi:hypothetical protein
MNEIEEHTIEQHQPALKVIDTPRLYKDDDARTFLKIMTREASVPDNAVMMSQSNLDDMSTKYRIAWCEDESPIDPASYEGEGVESCNFKEWLNIQ